MLLYNTETETIKDKLVIEKDGWSYFVNAISETKLNELGYLLIDDSNYEFDTIYEYYKKVPSVYNNTCVIKYYKYDRDINIIKQKLINHINDPILGFDIEQLTIDINNCISIDELKNLNIVT